MKAPVDVTQIVVKIEILPIKNFKKNIIQTCQWSNQNIETVFPK